MNLSKIFAIIFVIISLLSIQLKADSIVRNREFDSINALLDKSLKRGDKVEAMKIMVDKGKMLYHKGLYSSAIMSLDSAIKLSNDGKDTLQYPAMKELYMECLNVKSVTYSYLSKYEEAIRNSIEMDKYNKGNNAIYKVKFYNTMGVVFAMSGKLKQAKGYYKQALALINNLEDENDKSEQLFSIYSNIGGIFVVQKQFDSAHIYLMEAQKLSIQIKDKKKELVCLQLLGSMNTNMGKYELAIQYYNEAYKLAMECGNDYMSVYLKLYLSTCYLQLKDYKLAQRLAFEGLEFAIETKMKRIEIVAMGNIATIYQEMGDVDNALKYILESNKIKDSLFSSDNEDKFLRQKTDFDMYKISVEKEMLNKNLKLRESQRLIDKLMIFIIVLLLIATAVIFSYKLFQQYRLRKQEQLKSADEKKNFEDEIEKKDEVIMLSSLSLAKADELIPLMSSKLKALRTNLPLKGKGLEIIKEMEEILSQLSSESKVAELNDCLKQIPSDFYDKLDILFPELTIGEKKICGLMSLGVSVKAIASMMGKSAGAMGIIKFRIKKKIKADSELDLCEYFISLRK